MIMQDVFRFLGQGLAASRPTVARTVLETEALRFWYATDTNRMSLWIGPSGDDGEWIDFVPTESIILAPSDETTALTTGTAKMTFRMPYAFTLAEVRASLTTAQTSGTILKVDLNEAGTSILGSNKLTFDNGQKSTGTAAQSGITITTISSVADSGLADNAEMTVDIDAIGDGTAKGLKVMLIGRRA